MISLYITSLRSGDGKTMFAAGLARLFQEMNQKVGFLKPVVAGPATATGGQIDPDAAFFQKAFSLEESPNSISVAAPAGNLKDALQQATAAMRGKKDVLVVEGLDIGAQDPSRAQLSADLSKALRASVIVVVRYSSDVSPEVVTQAIRPVKDALLGVIINAVPGSRLQQAKDNLAAPLEKTGIRVLSVVPEDRVLAGVSVAELAEGLKGKVLINANQMDRITENLMLGAMTLESGKIYFGRKTNKVAIIRAERPDMMLAAMHTSTVGIIATGETAPGDQAMLEAEVKKIPIIAVPLPTAQVAAEVEKIVTGARFRQVRKLDRLVDILSRTLDFKALSKAIPNP